MPDRHSKFVLERENFQQLLDVLAKRGFRVVGPTIRDGAIVYDTVSSTADLPGRGGQMSRMEAVIDCKTAR
jgi:sulfhydrogenase subunit beta (sulfur reductase)